MVLLARLLGACVHSDAAAPTWSEDLEPLVAEHCLPCHVDGGLGPMPLETWDQAAPWAAVLAEVTADRRMPPFLPATISGECGSFLDSTALTDHQIALFGAWSEAGAPQGPLDHPPASPAVRPSLPRVDVLLSPAERYTPDLAKTDDHRCFLVDPEQPEEWFLVGIEVAPEHPWEVHHVSLVTIDNALGVEAARDIDDEAAGPGWPCADGFGIETTSIAGYIPGEPARLHPEGTGIRIEGGRPLGMMVHYTTLQGVAEDRTTIALMIEPTVDQPARMERFIDRTFELAPGEPSIRVASKTELTEGLVMYGVGPHQHQLGRSIRAELVHADGTRDCLVDVPRWDVHWQGFYFYREPISAVAGDQVRLVCEWDTVGVDEPVIYGESTTDEMCTVLAYVTDRSP